MRIRLNMRPGVLFGLMLMIAAIVLMPMRLALAIIGLGDYGFTARSVSGSIWSARLNEVHVGDLQLGDLRVGLSPLPLLIGRAQLSMRGIVPVDAPPLDGSIDISRHRFAVNHMTATVPTGAALGALPVSQLELSDFSVRFENGSCSSAEGRVKAMVGVGASGSLPGLSLAQGMSGIARCDQGALLLPLVSQAGTETVNLRIKADGAYRGDLIVQPGDSTATQQLTLAGFQPGPSGYTLSIDGHF